MDEYNELYLEAYYENEADANKQISYVNAAAAFLANVLWILYILKVFIIPDHFRDVVFVLFPAASVVLLIPIFFIKTDLIRNPLYKYFILSSFLFVIMAINIVIPKHGVLTWPFVILLANHYYNPKVGKIIYIATIVAMFVCIYTAMFFGEYDPNLLGGGVIINNEIVQLDTFEERYEMLNQLRLQGNDRYLRVLLYYFLPRASIITMFFIASNILNKRTYKLLSEGILIHDEQKKAATELQIARNIQMNTLPATSISSENVEIVGELRAAKQVGGDLYDYLDIDENHVAIMIADASGKGVPAAMFMMKAITSFRDFATAGKTPSKILEKINNSLLKGNDSCMFVTCFLAILDKRNGELVYANAGHNSPIVGTNHNYRYLECDPGFVLGISDELSVPNEVIILEPGDIISLYTDGITEANNEFDDYFGEQRLLRVFNQNSYKNISDLHKAIDDEIASFVQDTPQSDDITLLTLKYNKPYTNHIV